MSEPHPANQAKDTTATKPVSPQFSDGMPMHPAPAPYPRLRILRHLAVGLFIAVYLSLTGYYQLRHVLGDSTSDAFAYFWTWDMYPFYRTESVQRQVVGETESGQHLRIVPNSKDRLHLGTRHDATRFDLDYRDAFLEDAINKALSRYHAPPNADPIIRLHLVSHYWPSRFNLPDDIYESVYGRPNPHRKYWRIVREIPVEPDSTGERTE